MDSRSLRSKASEETLISLLHLDPSPIETPPALEDSVSSLKSTSSAPGLSGSGHGTIFYLTRIQKFSSYLVPIFTSIHLANTSIIPLVARSVVASETYLLQSREIYQTSLTEPLLVALPIVAHVASGVALRFARRSQNLHRYGMSRTTAYNSSGSAARIWPPLSYISASGYAFAVFLAAHVGVNRVLPLQVEGDSSNIGLAFVAHGFARLPTLSWLAYTGLLLVGCGHMVWGAAKWLGYAPTATRQQRRMIWWGLHGATFGAFVVWAAGGLGIVAREGLTTGWVGKLYDDLFDKIPLC
ncbi:hypothetical protein GCG54_00009429 [Colletotrichum gloeosporioides]|uniref:Mitochondrial adapter protein MCP1 transmembrane domain-containing protein n=1 Tax=Colletotrichum gloeosporioides TaxID=474922 RepID=A0A8H4FD58_COLGL|nr:uncharacterized protein GCG54_00009429 [Colletotrichum gloeosporioides]KAF3797630.1 hypothetical protein GCG54_00009429 [Colletotrichum gloeosporioides]